MKQYKLNEFLDYINDNNLHSFPINFLQTVTISPDGLLIIHDNYTYNEEDGMFERGKEYIRLDREQALSLTYGLSDIYLKMY